MDKKYLDQKFDKVILLIGGVSTEVKTLGKRIGKLEKRMDVLEKRMDSLEKRMGVVEQEFKDFKVQTNRSFENLTDAIAMLMDKSVHKEALRGALA